MAEECDRISCISVLSDLDDGFGGLAVQVLQYIRDEIRGAALVSKHFYLYLED